MINNDSMRKIAVITGYLKTGGMRIFQDHI